MRWVPIIVLLLCSWAQADNDDFYLEGNKYVSASIISSTATLSSTPSTVADIAIHFKIKKGWHIYWSNPGESGLPTIIKWQAPHPWQIGPTAWPAPHRIVEGGDIITFGYSNELTLPSALVNSGPGGSTSDSVEIEAQVSWLVCKDICVPGRTTLKRTLSLSQEALGKNRKEALLIRDAISSSPMWQTQGSNLEEIEAKAYFASLGEKQAVVVEINESLPKAEMAHLSLQVFPDASPTVFFEAPKTLEVSDNLTVALPFSLAPDLTSNPPLSGTIVLSDKITGLGHPVSLNWKALPSDSIPALDQKNIGEALTYRLSNYSSEEHDQVVAPPLNKLVPTTTSSSTSLFIAILASLAAGLLLNIMPCVLPVISIKLMSFIEGVGEEAKVNRLSAFVFSLGIIASFLTLGFLVLSLRSLGHQVGWGFQFQYPGFVFALIVVVFVLALGFFELYTINAPGMAQASRKADSIKGRYARNFADGILATLLATPCAAPFLGTALAFAFAQPPLIVYLIFFCIGLGLALPYALVASSTTLLRFLPRPGPWMYRVREFMGILLLATVIWLIYVLGKFSDLAVAASLSSLLAIFFAFRLKHWVTSSSLSVGYQRILSAVLWGLCIIALVYSWQVIDQTSHGETSVEADGIWQPYSDELVEQSLSNKQIVFIDFTAAWCITCKANEQLVLSTSKVLEAFKRHQVATLKADWTTGDKLVGAALKRYGGEAVPYYVVIHPDKPSQPKILPTILTPSLLVEALKEQNQ